MTTSHASLSERAIRKIIDSDGNSYGDERERLRYYEAHSAILVVQTYLLPVLLGVLILVFGRPALWPLLIVAAITMNLPGLATTYLKRSGVQIYKLAARSWKRIAWSIPGSFFLLGSALYVLTKEPNRATHFSMGVVVGGLVGLLVTFLAIVVGLRKEQSKADVVASGNE